MYYFSLLLILGVVAAQPIPVDTGLQSLFVTLYDNDKQGGASQSLPIGACQNVEASMNDKTTSVNTHGQCVYLCQDADCAGRCIKLQPDCGWPECCPDHSNIGLVPCNFNDQTSSVKAC